MFLRKKHNKTLIRLYEIEGLSYNDNKTFISAKKDGPTVYNVRSINLTNPAEALHLVLSEGYKVIE